MVHALVSRRVVTPEGEGAAAVLIDGETIAAVLPVSELPANVPREDLGDLALLPGLVDVHTHINEPGRTEWEGFWTATRAAAAGGFTTVVDMPLNCLPETTNVPALEMKREAARGQAFVDFALWGGAVDGNVEDLLPLDRAGVAGFKCFLIYPGCEGFTSIDRQNLERAVERLRDTGKPLLVHAELAAPIEAATADLVAGNADWRRYETYLASRPDTAELEAIALLLALCRVHRFRLHLVHLSSAEALPMLRAAKREGLPVSVETCPHYLHCAAEDISDGETVWKCAPPIRSRANREALWAGLLDGTIDLIATDHSPCPPAMKRMDTGRFDQAWGGIASLSTALPVLWTECVQRGVPLARLVRWMSAAPAMLAGIGDRVGAIEAGKLAHFVAFDTEATAVVVPERLHYRHAIPPYMNETLRGAVRSTWLRGARVFHEGNVMGTARGQEYTAAATPNLRQWNEMPFAEAVEHILPCNGARAWAEAMAGARPVLRPEDLFHMADRIWHALPSEAWQQAFASHPRIGEWHAPQASSQSLAWSAREQSAAQPDEVVQAALVAGNRAYEARFRRVFLVCATGKSAAEMLALLQVRLGNEDDAELMEAAEQQRRITQLRLRRWLGLPAARCALRGRVE